MDLFLKEKSVYGNILVYPECEKSRWFSTLIGKKTFNDRDISIMKKLGYNINLKECP